MKTFSILSVAFLVSVVASAAWVSADPIEGHPSLVGYWKLDDPTGSSSAADSGPTGTHTGSVIGGVTLGQPGLTSLSGTAASFNGTDGKIDIPFATELNPAGDFTLELFARVDADSSSGYRSPLAARYQDGQGLRASYTVYATPNNASWYIQNGDGSSWRSISGPAVIPDQTVHLATTFDDNGTNHTKTLYLNGHPVTSGVSGFAANPQAPTRIGAGASSGSGNYWFDGLVDNVAIFDDDLPHQTVADHYNGFSRYANRIMADNPAAYWRLGEQIGSGTWDGAYDATFNHHGTYENTPAVRQFDTPLYTDIDTAVDFDGSNDYIETGLTTPQAPPLSIEAWIKTSDTDGDGGIVNKYLASSVNGYQVFMHGGQLSAWYFANGSNYTRTDQGTLDPDRMIADGRWHHTVTVFDANGTTHYVDGMLVHQEPWTGTMAAATSTTLMRLGTYPSNDGTPRAFFDGLLDEVAIYDYALTPEQVQAHFQASVPEPASLALLLLGLVPIVLWRRR